MAVESTTSAMGREALLGKVSRLSRPDKVALYFYLKQDIEPLEADEQDEIMLTKAMKDDVLQAEQQYASGQCITQEDFERRFARWL